MSIRSPKNSPSAIHLSRMLETTASGTAKTIIEVRDGFLISLHKELKKFMVLILAGRSLDWVLGQVAALPETTKRQLRIKKAAGEIVPLIHEFASDHDIQWFVPISEKRIFPFTPKVNVPISPLGYGMIDNKVRLIFAPTWKNIDLTPQQFRIWATFAKIGWIDVDPDFEGFVYINVSVPKGKISRRLSVRTDVDTVDYLTPLELSWVRRTLDEAMAIVEATPRRKKTKPKQRPDENQRQLDL